MLSSHLEAAQGVTSSGFGCRMTAAYEQRAQIVLFLSYFLVGGGSRRVGGTGTAPAPRAGAKPGSCLRGRCDGNVLPQHPHCPGWAGGGPKAAGQDPLLGVNHCSQGSSRVWCFASWELHKQGLCFSFIKTWRCLICICYKLKLSLLFSKLCYLQVLKLKHIHCHLCVST